MNYKTINEDPRFWLTPEEIKELREEVAEVLKYIESINKKLNKIPRP